MLLRVHVGRMLLRWHVRLILPIRHRTLLRHESRGRLLWKHDERRLLLRDAEICWRRLRWCVEGRRHMKLRLTGNRP